MNRLYAIILVAIFLASAACGGKKPPEQAAVKSRTVIAALQEMILSYEKKNANAFLAEVSGSFRDRESFSRTLASVLAKYTTIHFTINYSKMVIMIDDKGLVKPTVTWDAEWVAPDGTKVRDGGRTTLVFDPATIKLISIEGKNPFLAQPGAAPGKERTAE